MYLTINKKNREPNLPTIPAANISNRYKGAERLTNENFDRPSTTFQDTIQTNKDMNKYLKNYIKVYDIDKVALGTHVRYVTLDKDKKNVFRLGGSLIRNEPKYVVLSNGKQSWSVQKLHYLGDGQEPVETVFFKQVNKIDKLVSIIQKQQNEIEKLKQICKGLCDHLNIDIEYTAGEESDIASELEDASDYTDASEYSSNYSETSSAD